MRKFLIEVTIDPDCTEGSHVKDKVTFVNDEYGTPVPCHHVIIGQDATGCNDVPMDSQVIAHGPAVVTAHEIGHVIAREFNHPSDAAVRNSEWCSGRTLFVQEQIAWEYADYAFNHIRQCALKTYKNLADASTVPYRIGARLHD